MRTNYKLYKYCIISLMTANKTNTHKHVANMCFSTQCAPSPTRTCRHDETTVQDERHFNPWVLLVSLRGYTAPPGGFMVYRCSGLMVVHCISVTHLLVWGCRRLQKPSESSGRPSCCSLVERWECRMCHAELCVALTWMARGAGQRSASWSKHANVTVSSDCLLGCVCVCTAASFQAPR